MVERAEIKEVQPDDATESEAIEQQRLVLEKSITKQRTSGHLALENTEGRWLITAQSIPEMKSVVSSRKTSYIESN